MHLLHIYNTGICLCYYVLWPCRPTAFALCLILEIIYISKKKINVQFDEYAFVNAY